MASWRQETAQWDPEDLQLLNQERSQIEPSEFTKLVNANILAEIADEFADAIKT